MKKICFLLFLTMFGISTLDAQHTMHRDSTKFPKSTIQKDSTLQSRSMERDSTRHPQSNMQRDSSKLSKTMHRDSSQLSRSDAQRDSSKLYKSNVDNDYNKNSKSNMVEDHGKNDNKRTNQANGSSSYDLSMWPESSRTAAEEITAKYGRPDDVTSDELIWKNKGPWEKICVTKTESQHSFPIEHTDMLATTINYKVPTRKMDDLGRFDGSITFDRTQGTMTARCDTEANNILALNLANDIITGQKSVQRARTEYGNIIREKMNGGNPDAMDKLDFSTNSNTIDPDINTTGLTKADVTRASLASKSRN